MHEHDHQPDWVELAEMLENKAETFAASTREALDELAELRPERILDVGSGPGVAACLLAERFPAAEVLALDGEPVLLERATARAERSGVRLGTRQVQFPDGLTSLEPADLIWSSQTMHHVGDQRAAVRALAAALRPGGVLALAEGGLPQRFLPAHIGLGRPGLQERLDLAASEAFHRMRAELPDFLAAIDDWPAMLRAAGLGEVWQRTCLIEYPAPLEPGPLRTVRETLRRYRDGFAEQLEAEDLETLERLLDPTAPEGIEQRGDVFYKTAITVYFGRR